MPFWCGIGETASGGLWWLFPLFGMLAMAVMALVCFRVLGCWGAGSRRGRDEVAELRRELQEMKEDVRKLLRNPS
jgi:hypothetical protein